jgi:hypothetical protein
LVSTSEEITTLVQQLAGESVLVLKAVLVVDFIDEKGERSLDFHVTDDMSIWDFKGLLNGVLDAVPGARRRG